MPNRFTSLAQAVPCAATPIWSHPVHPPSAGAHCTLTGVQAAPQPALQPALVRNQPE